MNKKPKSQVAAIWSVKTPENLQRLRELAKEQNVSVVVRNPRHFSSRADIEPFDFVFVNKDGPNGQAIVEAYEPLGAKIVPLDELGEIIESEERRVAPIAPPTDPLTDVHLGQQENGPVYTGGDQGSTEPTEPATADAEPPSAPAPTPTPEPPTDDPEPASKGRRRRG